MECSKAARYDGQNPHNKSAGNTGPHRPTKTATINRVARSPQAKRIKMSTLTALMPRNSSLTTFDLMHVQTARINSATPDVLTVPRRQANEGHRRSHSLLVGLRAAQRVQELRRALGCLILEHELLVVEDLLIILLGESCGRVRRAEATIRQHVVQHEWVESPKRRAQPANSSEICVTSDARPGKAEFARASLKNLPGCPATRRVNESASNTCTELIG